LEIDRRSRMVARGVIDGEKRSRAASGAGSPRAAV
jgi:hypothetical protein